MTLGERILAINPSSRRWRQNKENEAHARRSLEQSYVNLALSGSVAVYSSVYTVRMIQQGEPEFAIAQGAATLLCLGVALYESIKIAANRSSPENNLSTTHQSNRPHYS